MAARDLGLLPKPTTSVLPRIAPSLLKDQAADLLRARVISGMIVPGTPLVEREVAQLLGVSRAPARDALIELEKEGLLVTRGKTRYVVELSEADIRERNAVRLVLEMLAARLAAEHASSANAAVLLASVNTMADAIRRDDTRSCVAADMEMHGLIWEQSGNRHLSELLSTTTGPLFGFIANCARHYDWHLTLSLHNETVAAINSGDASAAGAIMERHLYSSLERTLFAFRESRVQPGMSTISVD